MTHTYTEDLKPYPTNSKAEQPFTPVYARKHSSRNKPVKTWMIMAPIGLLVLGGGAAAMLMTPRTEIAPLTDPAPTIALPAPVETTAPAVEAAPLVVETAPAAEIAPAPVRTAPRQAAPAARRAAPTATSRVEAPPALSGPQPYTGSLNTGTPAPAPPTTAPTTSTPAPPPPVVVIEPQG